MANQIFTIELKNLNLDDADQAQAVLDFQMSLFHFQESSQAGLTYIKNFKLEDVIELVSTFEISADNLTGKKYRQFEDYLAKLLKSLDLKHIILSFSIK